MLTLEKLHEIITEKIDQLKKRDPKKVTPFTEVYDMSIKQRDRILIHADGDIFPADLFRKRAPNQTDVEYEYLEANFKTPTTIVWEQFQSELNRIWNDQNWKIDFKGNDAAKQYLEVDYPKYGSLDTFFRDVVTAQKEIDNNGVIALKIDIPYLPTIVDRVEVYPVVDDREELWPVCHYYSCERIIGYSEGVYAVIETDEKSQKVISSG